MSLTAEIDRPSDAFLGVERSLTGRQWRQRAADETVVRDHMLRLTLSEPLARALASRGITDGETYLSPTPKALFPDPSCFMDMDRAVDILLDALTQNRKVVVFADYDVDGATSAAQLVRWYRAMGKDVSIYIPDRLTEGYGPSPAAFRRIREEGADLVVTLDCGAAAYDAIEEAARIGLDVVVIDHHLMREDPPRAAAVVNPNRPGCGSGHGVLAAAGVTFVLLAALNRAARDRGLFAERAEPDIRQWLDLAALGAVCDVTALVGFNRAITAQGLKVMSRWENPGLKALLYLLNQKLDLLAQAIECSLSRVISPAPQRVNLSESGLSFHADDPLIPGLHLHLAISNTAHNYHIAATGRVVFCEEEDLEGYRTGVAFVSIRDEDRQTLARDVVRKVREIEVVEEFLDPENG